MFCLFLTVSLATICFVNGDQCWGERWRVGDTLYHPHNSFGELYIYTYCSTTGYIPTSNDGVKCTNGRTETSLPVCIKGVGDPCQHSKRWFAGNSQYTPVNFNGVIYIYTSCIRGFAANGANQPICVNGVTDRPLPICIKVEEGCPALPAPTYGSKKCDGEPHRVGASCRFKCSKRYYIRGDSERVCRSDNSWSGTTPWCVKRPECSVPPRLENGRVNGCSKTRRPLYEDSCLFECNRGFEILGSDNFTCRASGELTDKNGRTTFPKCVASDTSSSFLPYGQPRSYQKKHNVQHRRTACNWNNGGCSQRCITEDGAAKCECYDGYELKHDGRTCERSRGKPDWKGIVRETPVGRSCSRDRGGCSQMCDDSNGTVACSCRAGFRLKEDGEQCVDIDECASNNFGCSHLCINTLGGAFCICTAGFKLLEDNKTCQENRRSVNPYAPPDLHSKVHGHTDQRSCSRENGGCDDICDDSAATVSCSCRSGYFLKEDGKRCADINECSIDNFGCSHQCMNTLGGAYCVCPDGYKLQDDGKTCGDIDECSGVQLNPCDQICTNTVGSFKCSCHAGYVSHKEFKCQACRHNSYRSNSDVYCQECPIFSYTETDGRTSVGDCLCLPGFVGNLSRNIQCEDVNECSTDNFGCSDTCVNAPGSASCSCPLGFKLQADQKTCQDIDECSVSNGGCQGFCHNTEGSFTCSCSKGYTVSESDPYFCSDVDECLDQNGNCSDLCVNFPGSYYCSCPEGYHVDRRGRSCRALRCPKFLVPPHSEVRCYDKSDSSNKTVFRSGQLPDSIDFPSGTQCRVVCGRGYETYDSPRVIECQGNGKWNATLPECEVLLCPPLSAPENGDVDPPECRQQPMPVGTRCYFTCHRDHKLAGQHLMVCRNNLTWTLSKEPPRCIPIKVVPFISCPGDISVALRQSNESSVTLTLAPPNTNMDEFRVQPEWVVVGEPIPFPAGRTEVTYSVSTWRNETIKCEMSITVTDEVPPVFDSCPDSFEVEGDAYGVEVNYFEPEASDNVQIHSIIKNMEPNSTLTPGTHTVTYVAKDSAGNTAKCSFNITVSRAAVAECLDLPDPENGVSNCADWMFGKICEPICNVNYTLGANETSVFMCDESGIWRPSQSLPPCLPECPFGEVWSSHHQSCEEELAHNLDSIRSE